MRAVRVVFMLLIALSLGGASALADYVQALNPIHDAGSGQWHYYYIYHVENHALYDGWYWEITDLEKVVEVGTPADAANWEYNFTENWVRWTYVGSDQQVGDYTIATFDLVALAPPDFNRPWDEAEGDSGTTVGPLPEPGTIGLLLVGLGALGVRLRRKTKA